MLRIAALIQGGVTAVAVVVLLLLSDPIKDELLDGNDVALLGAGRRARRLRRRLLRPRLPRRAAQFGLYSVLLMIEGGSRLMFPLAVAVGIAEGVDAVALGIAVAALASLVRAPVRARPPRRTAPPAERGAPASAGLEFTLAHGGAFAAAVLLMMLSEQVLLSSGRPVRPRRAEGAAAAGFIFNILMVARAPLVLFQAVAASLLPHLTRLRSRGDETGEDAFRLSVNTTLLTIAGFAARHRRRARRRARR